MERARQTLTSRLGLKDTLSIIVGIIVGVGIYKAPGDVFGNVSGPWQVLGVWFLGGVLSLMGALCLAELASTYPRSGGDYVYLTRAYGSWVGFLFAWAQLALIRPIGGIAAPAYVFAEAAAGLFNLGRPGAIASALLAILVLTLINILGARPGKRTQNWLTAIKVLSLLGIVLAGFFWGQPRPHGASAVQGGSFVLAMVYVLYAYEGWNEAAYVSCEVRNPRRNLPLALVLGTTLVTVIYVLVNAAYLVGLGFEQARATQAGAGDLLALALGDLGGRTMNVLIMISVLGAINGMIMTGSRIFSELGADHRLFAPLGCWNPRLGTPVWSLSVQAALSSGMVLAVGILGRHEDGFEALLKCTASVFWLFFLLTGLALFVLRFRDPDSERPFRVPGYPLVPLLFCSWSAFMFAGSLYAAQVEAVIGGAILLAGVPLYFVSRALDRARTHIPVAPDQSVQPPLAA